MSKRKRPWSFYHRVYKITWRYAWFILCAHTPKPLNAWRLFILRRFGCQIEGTPFVHQSANIENPLNLHIQDKACIGEKAVLYSLDKIRIGRNSIVAQESYLCTGTHEFVSGDFGLVTEPIIIGENAFIGARAFVLPGIEIGNGAVIGACSVVTKDVKKHCEVAGNPARLLT